MKQITLILLFFSMLNYCFGQVEFNQCKLFEEYFSKVRFNEIPYFTNGHPKPSISLTEAKDSLVEKVDYQTYEIILVNQKDLIKEQWIKYNESNKYIIARDDKNYSFHLVNTNATLIEFAQIKSSLSRFFSELLIDTSDLLLMTELSNCDSVRHFNDQNFVFNKELESLTKKEEYDLRGLFLFGSVYLTGDRQYGIISYDIYHKWINSNGEANGMETGGGGIIVVSLIDKQRILYGKQLWEY